ncbi:hypothetical protein POPTR_018G096021v4 [Populus trichocarpa]|uniref:Uncharacterized protein n=1 Tax=Populus trichocarpa TaxID=3694 RepID=A0ACC0RND9_POPTR|nr:hypothetical protein POPTR_018G096021v4 [Populus trichocarpa]
MMNQATPHLGAESSLINNKSSNRRRQPEMGTALTFEWKASIRMSQYMGRANKALVSKQRHPVMMEHRRGGTYISHQDCSNQVFLPGKSHSIFGRQQAPPQGNPYFLSSPATHQGGILPDFARFFFFLTAVGRGPRLPNLTSFSHRNYPPLPPALIFFPLSRLVTAAPRHFLLPQPHTRQKPERAGAAGSLLLPAHKGRSPPPLHFQTPFSFIFSKPPLLWKTKPTPFFPSQEQNLLPLSHGLSPSPRPQLHFSFPATHTNTPHTQPIFPSVFSQTREPATADLPPSSPHKQPPLPLFSSPKPFPRFVSFAPKASRPAPPLAVVLPRGQATPPPTDTGDQTQLQPPSLSRQPHLKPLPQHQCSLFSLLSRSAAVLSLSATENTAFQPTADRSSLFHRPQATVSLISTDATKLPQAAAEQQQPATSSSPSTSDADRSTASPLHRSSNSQSKATPTDSDLFAFIPSNQ